MQTIAFRLIKGIMLLPGSAAAAGGVIRFSNSYAHFPQTSA